jgi:hypothetical protein
VSVSLTFLKTVSLTCPKTVSLTFLKKDCNFSSATVSVATYKSGEYGSGTLPLTQNGGYTLPKTISLTFSKR